MSGSTARWFATTCCQQRPAPRPSRASTPLAERLSRRTAPPLGSAAHRLALRSRKTVVRQCIASPRGTSPSATIGNTSLTKEAHPGRATGRPLAPRLAMDAGQTASRMRPAVPLAEVFERHAETCTRAAEQTGQRTHRARLIRLAAYWRRAAQDLRQASDRTRAPANSPHRAQSSRHGYGARGDKCARPAERPCSTGLSFS
jgi:hypothetical protein